MPHTHTLIQGWYTCTWGYWFIADSPSPKFNKSGVSGKGKNITTKHDAVICGRRNASKIMDVCTCTQMLQAYILEKNLFDKLAIRIQLVKFHQAQMIND